MAKIISVELQKIPKYINVGDDVNDITVCTKIQFHEFDIKFEMPYCLHVFVYDIHGDVDAPVMLPNWDESILMPVTTDRKDDFLLNIQSLLQLHLVIKLFYSLLTNYGLLKSSTLCSFFVYF